MSKATLHFSDGGTAPITTSCVIGRVPDKASAVMAGDAVPIKRSDDPQMSRQHAQITLTPTAAKLVDLSSGNGTVVERGGERHQLVSREPFDLHHDDVVVFGQTSARFDAPAYQVAAATVIVNSSVQAPAPVARPASPGGSALKPSPAVVVKPVPLKPASANPHGAPPGWSGRRSSLPGNAPAPTPGPTSAPAPAPVSAPAPAPAPAPIPPRGAPPASRSQRPVQLAEFGNRLGAYFVDLVLYGLAMVGVIVLSVLASIVIHPVLGGLVWFGGGLYLYVMYFRHMGRGQTWGSRVAGVKVVNARTGEPIGGGQAFLRCLVAGFSGLFFMLGYLSMLWNDRKQTWHDRAVGSVVIKV